MKARSGGIEKEDCLTVRRKVENTSKEDILRKRRKIRSLS